MTIELAKKRTVLTDLYFISNLHLDKMIQQNTKWCNFVISYHSTNQKKSIFLHFCNYFQQMPDVRMLYLMYLITLFSKKESIFSYFIYYFFRATHQLSTLSQKRIAARSGATKIFRELILPNRNLKTL
jgi:hypothetical protein